MTELSSDPLKSSITSSQIDSRISSDGPRNSRNKSVQWADWELRNVMEFSQPKISDTLIDEYTQTELDLYNEEDHLPLINNLIQTSVEISSLASRSSRSASMTTCTTMEEEDEVDDAQQAALSDLISHLEDTAALLREHLLPTKAEEVQEDPYAKAQTTFLLKYQVVLVLFTQLVSILLLSLFDHLTEKENDTGYKVLTVACGSVLQILNMTLVSFATAVLSKQMLKYKVEGPLMAQTYLATVVTFAGLYFMIYRIEPKSWEFGSADKMEDNIAIGQFIKMLYLSVSAATLCGAANIQPTYWYVILILCFQSLINYVYFASVLAQTIGNYHSYTVQVRRSSSVSKSQLSL